MKPIILLADRTAVLFLGVAAGCAIGYAFGSAGNAPPPPIIPAPPGAPAGKSASALPPSISAAPELALPFQRHLLDTIASGGKVRVGVFGDSFGDGVWSALYRQLPASRGYQVVKYSQQSTGFTRYASLNLEDHAREQIAADGPVDIAVISFGANDTQGVLAGNHAAKLLSPEWQEVIGKRVAGFVQALRESGAMVYWVGLPKMRKEGFDADIEGMNAFYAQEMKRLGVPYMDVLPLTVDATGQYAAYLPDGPIGAPQERTLIRANDGVHMSMTGYIRITRTLSRRIDAYVASARAKVGPVAPNPPASTTASSPPRPPLSAPDAAVSARRAPPPPPPRPIALPSPRVAARPTASEAEEPARHRAIAATRSPPDTKPTPAPVSSPQ